MMNSKLLLLTTAASLCLASLPASAGDRYRERPPVIVSPDLSAPWVIQLGQKPGRALRRDQAYSAPAQLQPRAVRRKSNGGLFGLFAPDPVRTAALPSPPRRELQPRMDPVFLPQQVDYSGPEKAGSIVIDSGAKFLYLVEGNGRARRYGVGVGKEGFGWTGKETITQKKVWPEWRPPSEMISREREKGRFLPAYMDGGPANPLGARAMYLGSTLYRIHGTNAPWTIGTNVSSGCIRLRNEDIVDLYERVEVGTQVIVL